MYPDDGGLKPQVRPLGENFNGFKMLVEHFKETDMIKEAWGGDIDGGSTFIEGWGGTRCEQDIGG